MSYFIKGEYENIPCTPLFKNGNEIWVQLLTDNPHPLTKIPSSKLGIFFGYSDSDLDKDISALGNLEFVVVKGKKRKNVFTEETFETPMKAEEAIVQAIRGSHDIETAYKYFKEWSIQVL